MRFLSNDERLGFSILNDSDKDKLCPFLKRDGEGLPYYGFNISEEKEISEERRLICDSVSLQLWCTDTERYKNCIFYLGEPIN